MEKSKEAGMFFLFGTRRNAKMLAQIERPCTKCQRSTVHAVVQTKRWFTLFFIPVIPLGSTLAMRCNLCGLVQQASPELKTQIEAKTLPALS
jgi:uncharacterized Zn finger protein